MGLTTYLGCLGTLLTHISLLCHFCSFSLQCSFPAKVCENSKTVGPSHIQHTLSYIWNPWLDFLYWVKKGLLCSREPVITSDVCSSHSSKEHSYIQSPLTQSHERKVTQKHTHTLLCLLTIPASMGKNIPLYCDLLSLLISGRFISLIWMFTFSIFCYLQHSY